MLKLILFLSNLRLDNILWVVFLINKGIPFFYILFLQAVFYSFYALNRYIIFSNRTPSKFLIPISSALTLIGYILIYIFTSYIPLFVAFLLLSFSYYTYHDNLLQRSNQEKKEKQEKRTIANESIIFLAVILSNYSGGLFANISWKIFYESAIIIKIALVIISPLTLKLLPEKSFFKIETNRKPLSKTINKDILKPFMAKAIIVSSFEFLLLFVAFKLRVDFISPYYIGLLYSIETITIIISVRYSLHFEALFGTYVGSILSGLVFFLASAAILKNSYVLIALGLIFTSASRYLNESCTNLKILSLLKVEKSEVYSENEDFFVNIINSIILVVYAITIARFTNIGLVYLISASSLIYFALLIF